IWFSKLWGILVWRRLLGISTLSQRIVRLCTCLIRNGDRYESLLTHFEQRKRLSPCDRWILTILNNLCFARRKPYKPVVPEIIYRE
ncbi:MAG TPA: hypothetical protein VK211_29665, partial [Kamptonema sp.]|nr:hypothetical protein [Kamptonema sp.]